MRDLRPHQFPDIRLHNQRAAHLPHVRADHDSFAMVSGSYKAAAQLYLCDPSS